jgi:hypothetical protein
MHKEKDMKNQVLKMTLIVVSSAIAGILLFIAVLGLIAYYKFGDYFSEPYEQISTPPEISVKERFLGTAGVHVSGFEYDTKKVLTDGKAKFIGNITSDDGKPVVGLKIKLALNGNVYSQWASTDSDGKYEISAPPGNYRVDGYKLDYANANEVLGGKTDYPHNPHSTGIIKLEAGQKTRALDLKYVDPVNNISPKGEFSLSNPVDISWDPYPNAKYYRVQIIEQKNPRDYKSHVRLFKWEEKPFVGVPSLDLSKHGVKLKKNYFYSVEVEALDKDMSMLSKSSRSFDSVNFKVVD